MASTSSNVEPFYGLSDFLSRHTTEDDNDCLSTSKIFVAYRAYITRKKPHMIISMDFPRFCSYLEEIATQLGYKKLKNASPQSSRYKMRFRKLKKIAKVKKAKTEESVKVKLRNINDNLCCKLCCGYLVNASTITECLHSFCRSCIVRHFYTNRNCPACDCLVHESAPLSCVKPDNVLQDIVDKLLPGLQGVEKSREEDFYQEHGDNPPHLPPRPESFFKPIQFVLEWVGLKNCTLMADQIPDKFVRVSSRATIAHVSQFVLEKLQNLDADGEPMVFCDIKSGGATLPPILPLEAIEKHGLDFERKKGWILLQYDIRPLPE